MGNINIHLADTLHMDLKIVAAKTGLTLKAVIIKILEDAIRKEEVK